MRRISSVFSTRKSCVLTICALFATSRIFYAGLGVRFDMEPLTDFWQLIDPALLSNAPWTSLFFLRTQPPGFNFFVAVIMHLFPRHSILAFDAVYLGLGLTLAVCLFLLLDRLRVNRPLALLIAVICVASPVTVLYENWLFYEYPVAVLFCLSALFLHRYASSHGLRDGVIFFTSLAVIGMLRAIYHLLWFGLIAAVVIYVLPKYRRRTAFCAALPGALLFAIFMKGLLMFGVWLPGSDVYSGITLAHLTSDALSRNVLVDMAEQKRISPILLHGFQFEDSDLLDVVPLPSKTGIAILDQRIKSTGKINMDSVWMGSVGQQLRRDGLTILRAHPSATLKGIRMNVEQYFHPADTGWPFGGTQFGNVRVLEPLLKWFDLVTAGKSPAHNYTLISYLTIPLLLGFGFWRSARWLTRLMRRHSSSARDLTIAFAFGNIVYLSVLVIFFDFADQNRILFEVFPLFTILLALLVVFEARSIRGPRRPRFGMTDTDHRRIHHNILSGD